MAQTSVHIKACDIAASEAHNKRTKELDYVRKDLTHLNESYSYIGHSLQTELANIRRNVKEQTGRKLQKNAVPIKEGVVVIDDKTTMADLQRYCDECRNKLGIVPLQIHIHRDEGHAKAKGWKPNLHAHIVWRMYDDNGRNVRLSKQDCRDLQTLAAEVLGMERGKSSDKKHLDAMQYKVQALEDVAKNLSESKAKVIGAYKGAKQGVSDLFTGKARKSKDAAEKRAREAEKREKRAISDASNEIAKAEARIQAEKHKAAEAINDKNNYIDKYNDKIKHIDDLELKNRQLSSDNTVKNLMLDNIGQEIKSLSNLIDVAKEQMLSVDQVQMLKDGKEIEAPEQLYFRGKPVAVPRGSRLKYKIDLFIQMPLSKVWKSLKTWLETTCKQLKAKELSRLKNQEQRSVRTKGKLS